MLPLVETFYSIQGEGRRAGYNSLFIRFGGCNFRCPGFGVKYTTPDGVEKFGCDTWMGVDPAFKKQWDNKDSYKEIISQANDSIPSSSKYHKYDVVITGGEPTMFWKNQEFQNLLIHYISRGHKVTIETNASLDIEFTKDYQSEIMFSMSVKLSNSGEPESKRINIDNISNIAENTKDSYFKFVINAETKNQDMKEIMNILESVPNYLDVFLMPLGDTMIEVHKNRGVTAELCVANGFMYSDRMHIAIWDNKKGV
jgi:organic radical activating enzyme